MIDVEVVCLSPFHFLCPGSWLWLILNQISILNSITTFLFQHKVVIWPVEHEVSCSSDRSGAAHSQGSWKDPLRTTGRRNNCGKKHPNKQTNKPTKNDRRKNRKVRILSSFCPGLKDAHNSRHYWKNGWNLIACLLVKYKRECTAPSTSGFE